MELKRIKTRLNPDRGREPSMVCFKVFSGGYSGNIILNKFVKMNTKDSLGAGISDELEKLGKDV